MIDKQKLLQWVEEELEVYGPPYNNHTAEEIHEYSGRRQQLRKLERAIELGEFNQE